MHNFDAQTNLRSKIRDLIEAIGGKKKGRFYGLVSQECNAPKGESFSSEVSSNSLPPW